MENNEQIIVINTKDVESRMIKVRNQLVILDCDVAALYDVKTREVNQAVRNNPDKFPSGYVIELTEEESSFLRSKILTLENSGDRRGKHSKFKFKAFTERGLYMLATILKGARAVQTTLAIIETFAQVREMSRTMEQLQNVSDGGVQQQTLMQRSGEILANVIGQNLTTESTETEIELNFAVVKIKHKIIKKHGK